MFPIVLSWVLYLLFIGPAAYFDDNSTLEFLKRRSGTEAGWFGFINWLQEKWPKGWTWIKAALMLLIGSAVKFGIPALGAALSAPRVGLFISVAGLMVLCLFETVAILENYAKNKR